MVATTIVSSPSISYFLLLLLLIIIFISSSATAACERCMFQSKLSSFSGDDSLVESSGSCGYASLAATLNSGHIAAASPKIYKDGTGCGACYKIRCKDTGLCAQGGTVVMVTDDIKMSNNQTDFVISVRALRAMANVDMDQLLLLLGKNSLDVEYKRVPCEHGNKNLAIRVEESSQKPNRLAITFLNQGGETEIVAVDVAQVGFPSWGFMKRSSRGGAIWETNEAPTGPLQFRLSVTAGFDGKWYWANNALPADWKNGEIYDSGLQITDIAHQPADCYTCDDQSW